MSFLSFREGAQGYYVFAFTPYWHTFEISYGTPSGKWENLEGQKGISEYDFQKNTWYFVRVEAYGAQIKVYLDRKLVFAVEDTRLKEGGLALHTGPNTIAQFDDIQISK